MSAAEERKRIQEKLVAAEIRNYHITREELSRIRRKQVKPVTIATMIYMERVVDAIDMALQITAGHPDGKTRIRMLNLKYWENNYNKDGIMMNINVAKTTYYKWNRDFIKLVADILGFSV